LFFGCKTLRAISFGYNSDTLGERWLGLGGLYDLPHPLVFQDRHLLPFGWHTLELGTVYELCQLPAPHIGQERVLIGGHRCERRPRHYRGLKQRWRLGWTSLWWDHWSGHSASS
jgi:hypothetical protein